MFILSKEEHSFDFTQLPSDFLKPLPDGRGFLFIFDPIINSKKYMVMKKGFLLAVLLFSLLSINAQEPLSFEKVITVDSVGKDKIYSVIKEWYALNGNSKQALEVDDRSTGVIISNLSTDYFKSGFWYTSYTGYIFYKVTTQVRDGRFKVVVTNFEHDTKVKSVSRLGLITTGDYDKPSINKSFDIKVWAELKIKAKDIADNIFVQFGNLKFKSDNW